MPSDPRRAALAMLGSFVLAIATIGVPAAAQAWGVPGCTNLPEYNRALGALQGMTSACDMTVEQARRIVAEHDGIPVAAPPVAPAPQVRHGRRGLTARHRRPPAASSATLPARP